MPGSTSSGAYDGFGDGTLLWGSSATPNLAVSVEEQFTESTITVTDLVGDSIGGVSVYAHGFSEITNPSGEATLPLLASGSFVEAEDPASGMGSSATLSPPGGEIQIAIVPGTGDWTIPAGVDARLVNGDFTLDGDLIIESTASLMLIDSTLSMQETANLTIQSNGQLKGDNGSLQGGTGSLTAGVPFKGEGNGLTVSTSLTFTCYDPWTWVSTSLTGPLHLNQDCELILDGGHVSGALTVETDAKLTQRSHLKVTVIDAGNAVEGANVSIAGAVQQTDANGEVGAWYTWKVVDENGEIDTSNQQTVVIQHANVNRYQSWNPTSSAEMEVMISTVPTAQFLDWSNLTPSSHHGIWGAICSSHQRGDWRFCPLWNCLSPPVSEFPLRESSPRAVLGLGGRLPAESLWARAEICRWFQHSILVVRLRLEIVDRLPSHR